MTTSETTKKATRQFWKRCFQVGFILLVLLGVLVWICLFRETLPEISKESTYLTEPLTPDGKRIDYLRALEQEYNDPKMKTDENGYRLIVRALGPQIDSWMASDIPLLTKQVYEKLGLDPTVKPSMTYEEPYDFLEKYAANLLAQKQNPETATNELDRLGIDTKDRDASGIAFELMDEKLYRPWTLEEMPMMGDWLEQNGPALDLVAKAVRKPVFCVPLAWDDKNPSMIGFTPVTINQARAFARGLGTRASYRIGTGDIDGAIDDLITIKTLGRRLGHQGSLTDALVGVAIEGIANAHGIAESLDHQPTEVQLDRFASELENLPPRVALEKPMHFEHYKTLDTIHIIALSEKKEIEWRPGEFMKLEKMAQKPSVIFGSDWNIVMERVNYYFDHQDELADIKDLFGLLRENYWKRPEILLPSSRSEILAYYMISSLGSSPSQSQEAFHHAECSDNLQKITLAMLKYEKQHGRLPPAYTVDKDGKPLHSWRVLLLPYLGKEAKKLHTQIKLDEPWDSQHNSQFHKAAVDFYQCPSCDLKPGKTVYSVIIGKKTAFQAGEGKTFHHLGPNSANMILVIESNNSAYWYNCWMDPDSNLTEKTVFQMLEDDISDTHQHSSICTGLRNGSIHSVSRSINRDAFRQGIEGTKTDWND